jgi:hypothetical protein
VRLVKAAVDQLVKEQAPATLEAICRTSIALDPERRGIKKSALLENPEAYAYYREHSTSYRTAQVRKRKSRPVVPTAQPVRIDVERDVGRARYRYLQLTKSEIVERLLQVEQAYAELAEQQAHLQFKWAEQELQRVGERKKRKGAGVNESKKY